MGVEAGWGVGVEVEVEVWVGSRVRRTKSVSSVRFDDCVDVPVRCWIVFMLMMVLMMVLVVGDAW